MNSNLSKECGCKGIRSCLLCRVDVGVGTGIGNFSASADSFSTSASDSRYHDNYNQLRQPNPSRLVYQYCIHCQQAWLKRNLKEQATAATEILEDRDNTSRVHSCCHGTETSIELPGIDVIEHFVSQEEESNLAQTISSTPYMKSQSGRRKQDFGPKVNFKRQKLKVGAFNGLPSYSRFLYERMKQCKLLTDFEPVEMCNLEYSSDRGAHIDSHIDDVWIWGERLVTLNLLSDSFLSFTHDSHPDLVIQVPLLRRSLLVVSGQARYDWKHGIEVDHISGLRLAMTFRELSDEFKEEGLRGEEGKELLKLALTFEGCEVGCAS